MLGNIEELCSPTNKNRFTCAGTKVVYNASIIWGSEYYRTTLGDPELIVALILFGYTFSDRATKTV